MPHVSTNVCSRQSRLQQPLQSPCGPSPLPSAKAAPHFRLLLGQHPTLRTKISPVIFLWVTHSPRACTTSYNFWGSGAWGALSGLAFALRSQSRCHHPGLPSLEGSKGMHFQDGQLVHWQDVSVSCHGNLSVGLPPQHMTPESLQQKQKPWSLYNLMLGVPHYHPLEILLCPDQPLSLQ